MIQRLVRWLRGGLVTRTVARRAVAAAPLRGTPSVRRWKTYAADTGYTWTYAFEGYRVEQHPQAARVYYFTLHHGKAALRELGIAIPEKVLEDLGGEIGREISGPEVYALAKLRLFGALDSEADPQEGSRFALSLNEAMEIWERLDL